MDSADALKNILESISDLERAGQAGFLIQNLYPLTACPPGGGDRHPEGLLLAGRRQIPADLARPSAKGAIIDADSDPHLQAAGIATANRLCEKPASIWRALI
ncbi:MAG: hypothetical protein R2875_12465 [Desulfobacterales bacterium]